ncbi:MAG: GTPase HflX [Candidatus Omnitrophica bacterium]|nr:GTPase HflX [Candidatus Omnitrophota bacterium]
MSTERAILVTVQLDPRFSKGSASWSLEDEAQELKELATSSGCRIVGEVLARRHQPMAGTFLGSGKLEEIAQTVAQLQGQVVVFNQELSPAQQRNIEEALRVKTIDRTQLILDIFAQRAKSQEGKIQVELAQLQYLLPRLVGKGIMLSRLGGGIGTRGPGEQKLELDRRRIRARIGRLSDELEKLGRRRQAIRQRRRETEVPVVALVGYTNAGKTTLLNRLTGAVGAAQNQLFTTLDPLARRLRLPNGETIVLTDTVGFLHHLPHGLIEAFKATLEEARDADLLLHVLDASHPMLSEHAKAVDDVLKELKLRDKPNVVILNKRDQLTDALQLAALERAYDPAVAISAKTGEGTDRLLTVIGAQLDLLLVEPTRLRMPAERADLVASIYQSGQVLQRRDIDGMTELVARLPSKLKSDLSGYTIPA